MAFGWWFCFCLPACPRVAYLDEKSRDRLINHDIRRIRTAFSLVLFLFAILGLTWYFLGLDMDALEFMHGTFDLSRNIA